MLTGKRAVLPAVAAVALLLLLVYWFWRADREAGKQPPPIISVIAGSGDSARWRALDQGIQQACAELGIENPVPVIAQSRGGDPAQLEEALARELDNGAQGFLIVGEEDMVSSASGGLLAGAPVVTLGGAHSEIYPAVNADDAAMGIALADYMAGQSSRIAVLEIGLEREAVARRYAAFCGRMEELGIAPDKVVCDPEAEDLKARLASTFATREPSIGLLAVLDNDTLETAVEALPISMVDVTLCGVGSSDKLVHALDSGDVHCLVYENEYAAGYMGTMLLAREMGLLREFQPAEIQYRLVTRDTMYLEENEQLLFPISQ